MADRQGWEREDVEAVAREFGIAAASAGVEMTDEQERDAAERALSKSGAVPNRVVRELVEASDELKRALALLSRDPADKDRRTAYCDAQDGFDAALDAARPYLGEETRSADSLDRLIVFRDVIKAFGREFPTGDPATARVERVLFTFLPDSERGGPEWPVT